MNKLAFLESSPPSKSKWEQAFINRVNELKEKSERKYQKKREDRRNLFETYHAQNSSFSMVDDLTMDDDNISYRSLHSSITQMTLSSSCKVSIDTISAPKPHEDYNRCWGSQFTCLLCHHKALNESIMCKKCNCIAHFTCAKAYATSVGMRISTGFICPSCEDAMYEDQRYYRQQIEKLREEKLREFYGALITRRARVFLGNLQYEHNILSCISSNNLAIRGTSTG